MPVDTGEHPDFIDPARKQQLARGNHALGGNPAFPDFTPPEGSKASNFEEFLASEQYRLTCDKINQYMSRLLGKDWKMRSQGDMMQLMQAGMAAIDTVKEIEGEHLDDLEQLAIDLVLELPEFKAYREPFDNDEFRIFARIGQPSMEGLKLSSEEPEPAPQPVDMDAAPPADEPQPEPDAEGNFTPEQFEVEATQDLQNLTPEISKRQFVNALVHGSAISKNYAFHMVQSELNQYDPRLVNLYGLIMSFGELGYFVMPDSYMRGAIEGGEEVPGGTARVGMQDGKPIIRAEAINFPVLVQEIVKGLMELTSRKGLPNDPKAMKHVIDKADLVDHETWAILMGRGLWNQLLKAIDTTEDELTMFLYDKVVSMPPDKFNAVMRTIQGGGTKAAQLIKQLAQEIRRDLEAQKQDEEQTESRRLSDDLLG